ncbi:MAG: PAS domain S-box protein [Deltaproteobacteria bacterium]|nr:MAG: PAS domain S-box protein [Deltaproteobacteria bacterium]
MAKRTERSAELQKPAVRRDPEPAPADPLELLLGRGWGAETFAGGELYRTLAETATDAIVTIDEHSTILFANRAAERTFGYAREALVGQSLTVLMPADLRERHLEAIQRYLLTAKRRVPWQAFELPGLHKEGHLIPLEISLGHFTQSGRHFFAGIMRDLTARKRSERRLAVQHVTTRILAESATLDEATPRILQAIAETLGWQVGAIWIVDRGRKVMRCVELWHVRSTAVPEFEAMSRRITLPPGAGLPGRVWATGESAWICDIADDPNFPRVATARREGLHGGFAFPIRVASEVLGVVEFFSRAIEQPDKALLQMTEAIGSQIGQFMERRRAEQAARESHALVRSVIEGTTDAVFVKDREGRYLMINSAGAAALRGTVDDVLGKDDRQLLPPETAAALQAADHEVMTTEATRTFEDVITTADGPRTYLTTKGPYRDPAGNVVGVIGIARDITERSELLAREQAARAAAEAAERRAAFLAEGERLLASSLDLDTTLSTLARLAVPELADWCSVDVLETDGSVRRIAVAHADPSRAEIARQLQVYPPDPAGRHPRSRVLRTGRAELIPEITEAELAAVAASPEHFEVMRRLGYRSCMIVPLVARGRSLGALTFVTAESGRRYGAPDLSLAQELAARAALAVDNARLYREAQEALGQAERANRAKDEFLATVSHELRTPLSAVLLWTRLIARGSLDGTKQARALELIERNAKLQAQLVEDLLDVSRIVSGKLRVDLRPMDLGSAVEAALDAIRPAAETKSIRIESSLEPSAALVAGDSARLQQVVWNLLSNAIKFTPKGGRVDVRLRRAESHVELGVSDTGEGISADFLPHVFERFRQADSTSTRAYGGLGLGLGIVRHLVELHGGTVRAESAGPGQGATFIVRLPMPAVRGAFPRPEAAAAAELSLDALPALDGVRVLVVDDEPDARAAVVVILQERQASVTAVGSVAEALDVLERDPPDVLLSDIAMPGEDGFTLIRRVRGLPRGRGRGVPAAALTARAAREDRMRVLLAGYQSYLVKPVEPAELVAVIANLAGRTGTSP